MKRVGAVCGLSYMTGLIICNFIAENCILPLTVAFCAFAAIAILIPKSKAGAKTEWAVSFILAACACLSFTLVRDFIYKPSIKYTGQKCEIKATVLDLPTVSSGGNYSYLIKTDSINGNGERIRMMLYVPYELPVEPYDKVELSSYPFIIGENDDSYFRYFRSKRTYTGVFTRYDVNVTKNTGKGLMSCLTGFKSESIRIIRELLPDDLGAFSVSVLFGNKTYLSPELKQQFTDAGISHIMCVSGLHMSIWIYGLYRLLERFYFSRKKAGIISLTAALVFVCLSSFTVSVIRAAIMTGIYISAGIFGRKSDALNSLGVAIFFICLFNPFVVCDISFLLSVFATLGIILTSELSDGIILRLSQKRGTRIICYVLDIVLMSIGASVFTLPVVMGFFSGVSLVSWLSNLAVIPVMSPVMLLSGILVLFPSLSVAAYPVSLIITVLEKYIFFCIRIISSLPFAYLTTENVVIRFVVPASLALAVLVIYSLRRKKLSAASLFTAAGIISVNLFS